MQTVTSAFTAEEKDSTRRIAHNFQVSWKKFSTLTNKTFTIGVSTIGGNDVIGINPGAVGSPGNYKYFDESDYVTSLSWERKLNYPTGGMAKALAEAELDNTSGRFTPRHMGGSGELFTSAYLPRRPIIINAGFEIGADITIPQFSGVTTKPAEIDTRSKLVKLQAADYIDYFQGKYLDQSAMYTGQRTDQIMSTLLQSQLGMNTAQYDLDYGINFIPFAYFPVGSRMSDIFDDLAEAEAGHFYQTEEGIFKFENRQHWDSSPYTSVQKIIYTADVIEAKSPDSSHLINVVEIKNEVRAKQANQILFQLANPIALPSNGDLEVFVNFDDPILELTTPSQWVVNTNQDNSGTDKSTNIHLKRTDVFAQAAKIIFTIDSGTSGYLTELILFGRPARVAYKIDWRSQDDSSVTAYEEHLLRIENPYIQSQDWANSMAQMILNDYSDPEKLQTIVIRAKPELQMGDLISWQGRYWRIFGITSFLDTARGFLQELILLQRTIASYFRIGISTIGGTDRIAP